MRNKKSLAILCFLLTPLFSCSGQSESDPRVSRDPSSLSEVGDFVLMEKEGGVYIADYKGKESSLSIPSSFSIDGKTVPVTGVASFAFWKRDTVTTLDLPNTIKTIEDEAFSDSKIKELYLSSVPFHASPKMLEGSIIQTSSPYGDGAKYLSSRDTTAYYLVGAPSKKEVVIPSGCVGLADGVLSSYEWNITFPDSIINFGTNNFGHFNDVTLPKDISLAYAETGFLGSYSPYIESITLLEGFTTLPDGLFESFHHLKKISSKSPIKSIGKQTFGGCDELTDIELGNAYSYIGEKAFEYCWGLTSFSFPDTLTDIGPNAFSNCRNLKHIDYDVKRLSTSFNESTSIFDNPCPIETVNLGEHVEAIPNYFLRGSNIASLTFPSSLKEIGDYAFAGCKNLASNILPPSLTKIGEYAFSECALYATEEMPNTVESVGAGSFEKCVSLTELGLSSSMKSIPDGMFRNCSNLTSISIPEGVTEIGDEAFYNCENLVSVILPSSLTSIGNKAFHFCQNLRSLNFPKALKRIGDEAFYYCGLASLDLQDGLEEIGRGAFKGLPIAEVEVPSTVKTIGYAPFEGCTKLVKASLPHLGERGTAASIFGSGSLPLTHLTLSPGDGSLKAYALKGCDVLTDLKLGRGYTVLYDNCLGYLPKLKNLELPFFGNSEKSSRYGNNEIIGKTTTLDRLSVAEGCEDISATAPCSAKEVVFPSSLTYIKEGCLCNQFWLESLVVPFATINNEQNERNDLKYLFDIYFAYEGTNYRIPPFLKKVAISEGVTSMGLWSFDDYDSSSNLSLDEFIIPSSVTSVGYFVSSHNGAQIAKLVTPILNANMISFFSKSIEVLEGCTSIPDADYSNRTLTLPSSLESYPVQGMKNTTYYIHATGEEWLKKKDGNFNSGCEVHLLDDNNEEITELELSTAAIPDYSFRGFTGLTSIRLLDGVKTIGSSAFSLCDNVETLVLPSSLESVGEKSFLGMSKLKSFTTSYLPPYRNEKVGWVFRNTYPLQTLFGDEAAKAMKDTLEEVVLLSPLKTIPSGTFAGCSHLTTLVLPDSLESISSEAFDSCIGLTELSLPKGLISLTGFSGCTGLTSVSFLEDAVLETFESPFDGCPNIETLVLPSSVKSASFGEMAGLKSLTLPGSASLNGDSLPQSVNEIYVFVDEAFSSTFNIYGAFYIYGATNSEIARIEVHGQAASLPYHFLYGDFPSLTELILDLPLSQIGDYVFFGKAEALKELVIPDTVETIGDRAFQMFPNAVISGGPIS